MLRKPQRLGSDRTRHESHLGRAPLQTSPSAKSLPNLPNSLPGEGKGVLFQADISVLSARLLSQTSKHQVKKGKLQALFVPQEMSVCSSMKRGDTFLVASLAAFCSRGTSDVTFLIRDFLGCSK